VKYNPALEIVVKPVAPYPLTQIPPKLSHEFAANGVILVPRAFLRMIFDPVAEEL